MGKLVLVLQAQHRKWDGGDTPTGTIRPGEALEITYTNLREASPRGSVYEALGVDVFTNVKVSPAVYRQLTHVPGLYELDTDLRPVRGKAPEVEVCELNFKQAVDLVSQLLGNDKAKSAA